MMTTRARFKEADLTRAIKAAVKAGLSPSECAVDPQGCIRLTFAAPDTVSSANPLDRLLLERRR